MASLALRHTNSAKRLLLMTRTTFLNLNDKSPLLSCIAAEVLYSIIIQADCSVNI